MNLHRATTNFYVKEYQDITVNTKLGKIRQKYSINPDFKPFEAQNDPLFVKNQDNFRMARNQKFKLQL